MYIVTFTAPTIGLMNMPDSYKIKYKFSQKPSYVTLDFLRRQICLKYNCELDSVTYVIKKEET